ncbi:MAG: SdrD B-like domain-containing protein [Chloroflexota bacterium]
MFRIQIIQNLTHIRSLINALMIAALLAGLIPPPALTHLVRTVAPAPLEPIAETVVDAAAELIDAIDPPAVARAAPGDNVALNKPASQSSTFSTSTANLAVDGNTDGNWGNGSVTHTNADNQAWWEVDLGSNIYIENIFLWNRTICCQNVIDNSYVLVSTTPFTTNDITTARSQADFEFQLTNANTPIPSIDIPVQQFGRYVRVHESDNGDPMHLAEVQVFEGVIPPVPGQVRGTVFLDSDASGVQNDIEDGLANIDVTAVDASGTSATATTDASGAYTITPSAGLTGTVRVEFTLPTDNSLDHLEPTIAGDTTVQFADVTSGATVNAGFHYPAGYCQANPDVCATVYVNGDANTTAPTRSMMRWPYDNSGDTPTPTQIADKDDSGSTWGVAYNRSNQTIYHGAFLKRHVGLGPSGLGAIYTTARDGSSTSLFVDLASPPFNASVGTIDENARNLGDPIQPTNDPDAYPLVGKVGLGDLDISEDNSILYAVSLNDKTLYAVNVADQTLNNSYPIPGPSCQNGEWRPFALKVHMGQVYAGGVCDGSSGTAADMSAHIYRLDGSTFNEVLTFPLNYTKGPTVGTFWGTPCVNSTGWYPWLDTLPAACNTNFNGSNAYIYPQPILSDIEFDINGDMILGFMDRLGHQGGQDNHPLTGTSAISVVTGGDILRACVDGSGGWDLESGGVCDGRSGSANGQGPSGGEFYQGDAFFVDSVFQHPETSAGGLALHPNTTETVMSGMDPVDVSSGGVFYLSNTDGSKADAYELYSRLESGAPLVNFGKAHGVGDVELLCDEAPLEIGNRVWSDVDNDGVQDPDEAGMGGVVVGLYDVSNTLIATATTDSEGNYYFSGGSGTDSDSTKYGLAGLTINTNGYEVRIDITQPMIGGRLPSPPNSGIGANGDLHDSDGTLNGSILEAALDTGTAGANNHTVDFGFSLNVAPAALEIVKLVSGGSVTDPFNVDISGPNNYSNTVSVTPGTPTVITDLDPGVYTVVEESPITTAAPTGMAWFAPSYEPASGRIALGSGATGTVTVTNYLGEIPTSSGVLTVTKTVDWNGTTPGAGQQFSYSIEGNNGFTTINDSITDGGVMTYSVPAGIYTVTETSPGAGWLTTYTVSSMVSLTSGTSPAPVAPAAISGTVFRDFNSDGANTTTGDVTDIGLATVTVTAYDPTGVVVGSTQTITDGTYSLTPSGAGPWRIEFTDLPAGYEPSFLGSDNDGSLQFVDTSGATGVDFAVNYPPDFCQANPDMCINLHVNGNTNASTLNETILKFNYADSGTTPTPTTLVERSVVGSTWGLAYARSTETLYAGAFLRRHVGVGPSGLGAIYAINANSGATTLLADLAAQGVDVGTIPSNNARGLGETTQPQNDPDAFPLVGRVGLGDVDISSDEAILYVVSLNDKTLYSVDTTSGLIADSNLIPNPSCSGGEWRPFAVKVAASGIYVGGVCDASTSDLVTDLEAVVYEFDGDTQFTEVFRMDLDYVKGPPGGVDCGDPTNATSWHPWRDTYIPCVGFHSWPTPMLSDIEVDRDGSLILGFADRFSYQTGYYNYPTTGTEEEISISSGDILRACNVNGSFAQPGSASCPNKTANNHGPNGGEYYHGETYSALGTTHGETAQGGLAQLPGANLVATTAMDPTTFRTGGVNWLSHDTGGSDRTYEVFPDIIGATGNMGKASGVGDIEVLCDAAPTEVGNRVWDDQDGDGVQDAGEPGLNGVQVTLEQTGQAPQQVNTSGDGNYNFSVEPNTAYTISVATPPGYSLTTPNAQAVSGSTTSNDAILDVRDSDALLVNSTPTILYQTGNAGQNNHGLDFGFVQPASGQVDIENKAPEAPPEPATLRIIKQVSGGTVTDPFNVDITGPNSYSNTIAVTPGTPLVITDLTPGTYTVVEESPITTAAPTGMAWFAPSYEPAGGQVSISSGMTGTITVTNYLGDIPTPSGVLTVTKTVDWNGTTPGAGQQFAYSIEGPSGFTTINDSIVDGGVMTYSVPAGVYTVTETSPGAGWVTTYTVESNVNNTSGVVTLGAGAVTPVAPAAISGTVFRDFNSDGEFTTSGTVQDTGLMSVTVTAYDVNGNAVGSTQSGNDGTYTLTPTADGPWRIEFTNLPAGYEPSFMGNDSDSSVQFVSTSGATDVDFGANRPFEYCQANPKVCSAVQRNGNHVGDATYAIGSINFNNSGSIATVAQQQEVGSVWGIAYKAETEQLFTSALVKRHVGLGSAGLGGIYAIDNPANSPSLAWALDLEAAPFNIDFGTLPDNTTRGLAAGVNSTSQDPDAWDAVGKQGIGDIDLSEDGDTLWAVNLYSASPTTVAGSLIKIDVSGVTAPTTAQQIPLEGIAGLPTCTNGILRPWALKFRLGKGYLGAVCSAENGGDRDDLRAYVLSFDPAMPTAGMTVEVDVDMTYTKGIAWNFNNFDGAAGERPRTHSTLWYPWESAYSAAAYNAVLLAGPRYVGSHPTPILTDIDFDRHDDMLLGFVDRSGHQFGSQNLSPDGADFISGIVGGDVLRACLDANSNWQLESGGACGGVTGGGLNGEGIGGGEFYSGEFYTTFHLETSQGGLAHHPAGDLLALSAMDPTSEGAGGLIWLSNTDGSQDAARNFYTGANNASGYFGKANGMGDVEILCDEAPLEVGNRVWDDVDGDGVQDAGEPGLNGVQVTLEQAGQAPQQVTTSGDGNYAFTVEPNTPYTISVATPAGYTLTTPNAQAVSGSATSNDAILDVRDSDGLLVNGTPTILYTSGSAGQNNHGLDFGFTQPASGQVDIENRAPEITGTPMIQVDKQFNGVGDYRVGETISFTIRITNTGDVTITTLPLEDRFNSVFLTYQSATPPPDPVGGEPTILRWTNLLTGDPNGLGIGEAVTVDVFFTTAADTTLLPVIGPCTEAGKAPNLAKVEGADASGTPVVVDADDEDCDSVEILNPTAVLLSQRSVEQTAEGVLLRWQMVDESNVVGFYIWKSSGVDAEMRSGEMIPSKINGQADDAESYEWLDEGATLRPGDLYLLEIVKQGGPTERVVIGVESREEIFLPIAAQ